MSCVCWVSPKYPQSYPTNRSDLHNSLIILILIIVRRRTLHYNVIGNDTSHYFCSSVTESDPEAGRSPPGSWSLGNESWWVANPIYSRAGNLDGAGSSHPRSFDTQNSGSQRGVTGREETRLWAGRLPASRGLHGPGCESFLFSYILWL